MLPKHPQQLSDSELDAWVRRLVDERVQEGPSLDYKQTVHLGTNSQRFEAAKDISSFANEVGGTLVYGIPEDRTDPDTAIPKKPYGIDPLPGLQQQLENVYVDVIRPALGEYSIRLVHLSEYKGKVVYVVWTPESWLGPHMVQGYRDNRYYRRGQLRAVKMAEHEIRDRYERILQGRLRAARVVDELESSDLITRFYDPCATHVLFYPNGLVYDRVDFLSESTRAWLSRNPYPPHGWRPAALGVQTELEQLEPRRWETYARLTRSGVLSVWRQTRGYMAAGSRILDYIHTLPEFEHITHSITFAAKFYEQIAYSGPLRLRLRMQSRRGPLRVPNPDGGERDYNGEQPLVIEIDLPASDLVSDPPRVGKRLADEFCRAFGLWEADWLDGTGR